jgi:hypothetical protein
MSKKHSRFSRQALIDRYFKRFNGYLILVLVPLAVYDWITGPRDFSSRDMGLSYNMAKMISPICGGYSYTAVPIIGIIVLIIETEFDFHLKVWSET